MRIALGLNEPQEHKLVPVNAATARPAVDELADKWGQRSPAMVRLRDNAWSEFIPFLDYDLPRNPRRHLLGRKQRIEIRVPRACLP
jgi:hypothetical protein